MSPEGVAAVNRQAGAEHPELLAANDSKHNTLQIPLDESPEVRLLLDQGLETGLETAPTLEAKTVLDLDEDSIALDSMGRYLKEISKFGLLNAEQEVELAQKVEAGLTAQTIIDLQTDRTATLVMLRQKRNSPNTVSSQRLPSEDDIQQLLFLADTKYNDNKSQFWLRLAAREGRQSKEHLVNANLRLVVSIAKRYQGKGVSLPDLIQDANIGGLMHAVEKFDYTKGFKFSTYASNWIKRALQVAVLTRARTIALPRDVSEQVKMVQKVTIDLKLQFGREPTYKEIASEAGIASEKCKKLMEWSKDATSFDTPVGKDGENTLGDMISLDDDFSRGVEETIFAESRSVAVRNIMTTVLDPRELNIVSRRLGFGGSEPETFTAMAERFGITREAVRQAYKKGLAKLIKDDSHLALLREYYELDEAS